jgi:hypothetical protein
MIQVHVYSLQHIPGRNAREISCLFQTMPQALTWIKAMLNYEGRERGLSIVLCLKAREDETSFYEKYGWTHSRFDYMEGWGFDEEFNLQQC